MFCKRLRHTPRVLRSIFVNVNQKSIGTLLQSSVRGCQVFYILYNSFYFSDCDLGHSTMRLSERKNAVNFNGSMSKQDTTNALFFPVQQNKVTSFIIHAIQAKASNTECDLRRLVLVYSLFCPPT